MKFKTIFISYFIFITNLVFAQYFNNTYNYKEVLEFESEIHLLKNGNLIEIGGGPIGNATRGVIIRELDNSGKLLSTDYVSNDSLDLYLTWTHTSTIIDSMLYIIATAQKFNGVPLFTYPYFLKYNINQKKLIDLKFYPRVLNHSIHSMVYHTDGYLYGGGYEYLFDEYRNRDMLIMKFDTAGNLIWEKNLNFGRTINQLLEIESFDNQLIITGQISQANTHTILAKLDTAANVLQQHISTPYGASGAIDVEVYKNDIYFTTTSEIKLEDFETQYLAKFTNDLQLVWDTLIPNTSRYNINCRGMEILNDEIIMMHNIREADAFTNNKVWTYASSWSLEGEFNWEHVYFYDSTYTHHLDDIEATPEGDLIFMGTVFARNLTGANQFLWLFKTNAQGCGTLQDTCYYTLDRYFGLDSTIYTADVDTIVNIIGQDTLISIANAGMVLSFVEPAQNLFMPLQVLGNPFKEQLHLQSSLIDAGQYKVQICNLQGQVMHTGRLANNKTIATAAWVNGLYIINLLKDDRLLWSEKLLKQ